MPENQDEFDPYADLETVDDAPLSLARRVVAQRLGQVLAEAVPVTLMRTVRVPASRPYDALIKSLVAALQVTPRFNGVFEQGRFRSFRQVNLGVAFDGQQGLVVPIVRDAGAMDATSLREVRAELAARVQNRAITMADLVGGTFTVSNLGPFAIEYFTPILNPPQVAILGVGRAAAAHEANTVPLSLTFDHRVNDGAAAASFLGAVQESLEAEIDQRVGATS